MFNYSNKNAHLLSAGFIALFLQSGVTYASTITFDRLPNSEELGVFPSVTQAGYTVQATGSWFWINSGKTNACIPECAYNGTQYLATQIGPEPIAVYKNDSGLFDLVSFEYAERHIGHIGYATYINVTGFVQDGSVITETVYLDHINDGSGPLTDFQTAVLPDTFRNLTMVHFATDEHFKTFSLDNIVLTDLDSEVLIPTQCELDNPEVTVISTGGGQSSTVNSQIQVAFTGHITTQTGLTSGGRNSISICPGSKVNYEVISNTGVANCTLNGTPLNSIGRLASGHVMLCSNKPAGNDTDRFSVK